jgi:hypothetical protein
MKIVLFIYKTKSSIYVYFEMKNIIYFLYETRKLFSNIFQIPNNNIINITWFFMCNIELSLVLLGLSNILINGSSTIEFTISLTLF